MNHPSYKTGHEPRPKTGRDTGLRLWLATLGGIALAAAVAWRLGGREGGGVIGGFLVGAMLAALGIAWQNHLLRTNPRKVFVATVGVFLLKLGVLLGAALAFKYIEAAANQVDWKSFLVAYAAGVLLVLAAGSLDTLRILKQRRSVA